MPLALYFVQWQWSFVGQTIMPFVRDAVAWLALLFVLKHLTRVRLRLAGLAP
jgi:hypothetical protein